jgi:hypothetical protein
LFGIAVNPHYNHKISGFLEKATPGNVTTTIHQKAFTLLKIFIRRKTQEQP